MRTFRLPRLEAGLASVELALVLPIFLMIMLATAEFGRALYQFNALTKAVRDGAQYLAQTCVLGTGGLCVPTSASQTAAQNLVVYGSLAPAAGASALLTGMKTSDVTIATSPSAAPVYVQVTAVYTYVPMLVKIPTFSFGSIATPTTLTATAKMAGL